MVRHNRFLQISLTALVSAFLIFSAASAAGKSKKSKKERVYRVAITNVTKDQIFSPPVLATHEAGFRVFMAGAPASAELVKVAEDGMNGPLATMLGASPEVFDVVAAGAPILPGATAYYEIHSKGKADSMSIVGMLVSTNDGFFGVNARKLSSKSRRSMSFSAVAYDAGSEGNNEDCVTSSRAPVPWVPPTSATRWARKVTSTSTTVSMGSEWERSIWTRVPMIGATRWRASRSCGSTERQSETYAEGGCGGSTINRFLATPYPPPRDFVTKS